jgi:prepilin peptidase CpaA
VSGLAACAIPLLVLSAAADIQHRSIPNRLPAAIAILFGIAALIAPATIAFLPAIAIAVTVLTAGLIIFALDLWGGGDAKLLTSVSLWAGADGIGELLFITAIAGGLLGLAAIFHHTMLNIRQGHIAVDRGIHTIPYGVAIAAAGIIVLVQRV